MTTEDRLAEQLERIVLAKIEGNSLTLPSLPSVALKALELLRSPEFSIKEVASLIERDPVLAAQVLRVCNSAAMASREPCRSISAAATRLGAQKLRTVLVEASAHKLFQSRDSKIAEASRKLWEHSRAVAVIARDASVLTGVPDPDASYMAGLLHDVGKPVIASLLLDAENQILQRTSKGWIDSAAWISVVHRTHRKVGLAMAREWKLEPEVARAIEQCTDFDPANRLSNANAVRFANALAKQQGFYVGPVEAQDNDALIMVGRSLLSINDDGVARLVQALHRNARDPAA